MGVNQIHFLPLPLSASSSGSASHYFSFFIFMSFLLCADFRRVLDYTMQPEAEAKGERNFSIRTDHGLKCPSVRQSVRLFACPSVERATSCELRAASCASAEFRPTLWCTIPVVLLLDVLRIQFELRLPHASVEFSAASAAAVGPGNA